MLLSETPSSSAANRDTVDEYLSGCRALVLDRIRSFLPERSRYRSALYDIMLEYPLRDAKALRPALCVATSRALGGSLEGVLQSAAVLELYHNAFLIHDDVEDGSERRRERATLHRAHGVPIAINVGDAMLALALEPLLDNMRLLGLGKALRILQAVARMARESAEGQALELSWLREARFDLSDHDYLRMVHKKTGYYTFITPVLIGGIVAGASLERQARLRRFATALGLAFQIQDDVLNLSTDPGSYGKDALGDLWEGKHTLVLLHALRTATAAERKRALAILAKPRPRSESAMNGLAELVRDLHRRGELGDHAQDDLLRHAGRDGERTPEDIRFLLELAHRQGSLGYARRVAARRARRAAHSLEWALRGLTPSVHVDFLRGVTRFVIERDH